MENMDKGLTVLKWVLIVWPKILQMPQKILAQFVCPSPKSLEFSKKKLSLGVRSPWTRITICFVLFVCWAKIEKNGGQPCKFKENLIHIL